MAASQACTCISETVSIGQKGTAGRNGGTIEYERVLEWLGSQLAKVQLHSGKTACIPASMVRESRHPETSNAPQGATDTQSTEVRTMEAVSAPACSEGGVTGASTGCEQRSSQEENASQRSKDPRQSQENRKSRDSGGGKRKEGKSGKRQQTSISTSSEATVERDMDVDCVENTDVSGTLRWKMDFQFPRVPKIESEKEAQTALMFYQQMMRTQSEGAGWASWLNVRLPKVDASTTVQSDMNRCVKVSQAKHVQFHPALLDALSFPVREQNHVTLSQ
eukprot:gb/GECG01007368.1/.p1 GENE.gb/GECG01007368.1/~~gb/GECG01007368.1/.p1  ORF type:complete len:277 (+),score=35.40 gb/GECG01007368.1/:1-831(+)